MTTLAEVISRAVAQATAQAKLEAHPVGSLYWSAEPDDPAGLFGGIWERVKDRFILAAGDDYAAGAEGGEAMHTLTLAESPAHTHTRGTMEIKGALTYITSEATDVKSDGSNFSKYPTSGALAYGNYKYDRGATLGVATSGSKSAGRDVVFRGSNGWTGATSSTGGGRLITTCRHTRLTTAGGGWPDGFSETTTAPV